jgi:hypothetical protein
MPATSFALRPDTLPGNQMCEIGALPIPLSITYRIRVRNGCSWAATVTGLLTDSFARFREFESS